MLNGQLSDTTMKAIITIGKALFTHDGVRCQGPRLKNPNLTCNKLMARPNSKGKLEGQFKCKNCGQVVEVG